MTKKEHNEDVQPEEVQAGENAETQAREEADRAIELLEEAHLENQKKKKRHGKKWVVALGTVAILSAGLYGYRVMQENSPIPSYSDATWEEEQFDTLKPVSSTLMDKSLLEVDTELGEWYESNIESEGVHTKTKGEFTYILVSGGVSEEERLMQLFDVKEGRKEVIVGYNYLNPEEIGVAISDDVPNMILRIKATELPIVGRNIEEEELELTIPEVEEDAFSEEE